MDLGGTAALSALRTSQKCEGKLETCASGWQQQKWELQVQQHPVVVLRATAKVVANEATDASLERGDSSNNSFCTISRITRHSSFAVNYVDVRSSTLVSLQGILPVRVTNSADRRFMHGRGCHCQLRQLKRSLTCPLFYRPVDVFVAAFVPAPPAVDAAAVWVAATRSGPAAGALAVAAH